MSRRPAVAAAALACLLVLTGCGDAAATAQDPASPQLESLDTGEDGVIAVEDRQPAPELSGTTLDGEPLSVADLRGQVVILNFWASWCPPCRNETPLLEAAQDNLGDDVALVGMDIWDAEGDARDFLAQYGVTYTVGHDDSGEVAVDYGVSGVPETFVIDAEGRIVVRFPGEVTSLEQLRGMVAEAR